MLSRINKLIQAPFRMSHLASFAQVKALKDDKTTVLIDVREPSELQETGVIPASINIPLGTVEDVLKNLSADKFKETYGRDKPTPDTPIVFSCKMGGRSEKATNIAKQLGFKNVKNYSGGWLDWAENMKKE